ncbi:MAG: hypothetical protein HUU15_06455 [Candidatus Brocadiae bacterium]|nr:hypothetical protein [Candidatus Brocadiia bacterium]
MKDRLCFNHREAPAVGLCRHCHRPYCGTCRVATPLGEFCCFDCSGRYAAFKSTWREPKLKFPWFGSFVTGLVLLVLLGLVAAWVGHRWLNIRALAPFDIISRIRS